MWEEEKRKFDQAPDIAETSNYLEDLIAAREEGKKRKKEVMEVKAGKRRKKKIWCGNHGEVPWGEAGSADTGKGRREFLYKKGEGRLKPGQDKLVRKLKIPLTENEMLGRQILTELSQNIEEENE